MNKTSLILLIGFLLGLSMVSADYLRAKNILYNSSDSSPTNYIVSNNNLLKLCGLSVLDMWNETTHSSVTCNTISCPSIICTGTTCNFYLVNNTIYEGTISSSGVGCNINPNLYVPEYGSGVGLTTRKLYLLWTGEKMIPYLSRLKIINTMMARAIDQTWV